MAIDMATNTTGCFQSCLYAAGPATLMMSLLLQLGNLEVYPRSWSLAMILVKDVPGMWRL